MALKLMYITNQLEVAKIAQKYGVDRIWIDLETLGKEERQHNMNTVKSNHSIDDIRRIAPFLDKSEMLVRINPWNAHSQEEIEAVIDAGADIIMLPMWKTTDEVSAFLAAVNNRVKTTLLLETKEAEECLDEVLCLNGIDEIHVGLNDLHLSYGLDFMFELLANGTVESICKKIEATSIPYGFGGIARIGEGTLPAEMIVLEHYRLGSSRVILSRSFCDANRIQDLDMIESVFAENMAKLRDFEQYAMIADDQIYRNNLQHVAEKVDMIVKKKQEERACC